MTLLTKRITNAKKKNGKRLLKLWGGKKKNAD